MTNNQNNPDHIFQSTNQDNLKDSQFDFLKDSQFDALSEGQNLKDSQIQPEKSQSDFEKSSAFKEILAQRNTFNSIFPDEPISGDSLVKYIEDRKHRELFYYLERAPEWANWKEKNGKTLMHFAAHASDLLAIEILTYFNADLSPEIPVIKTTPLLISIKQNNLEICNFFLKNIKNNSFHLKTILMDEPSQEILDLILQYPIIDLIPSIYQATYDGNYNIYRRLTKNQKNLNSNPFVLLAACSQNTQEHVKIGLHMLNHKLVDPNFIGQMDHSHNETTALIVACEKNPTLAKILIDFKADPNLVPSNLAKTPLDIAIQALNYELVLALVEKGKSEVTTSISRFDSISRASKLGLFQIVKFFLEIKKINLNYSTELMPNVASDCLAFAIGSKDRKTIELLLKNGAKIKGLLWYLIHSCYTWKQCHLTDLVLELLPECTPEDLTLALIASISYSKLMGNIELLKILLERGANPNQAIRTLLPRNEEKRKFYVNFNCYPLYKAALLGHLESVQCLLEFKADSNLGIENQMPLNAAINTQNPEIVKLLLDHGASPRIDAQLQIDAIKTLNPQIIELILKNGADPNIIWEENEEEKVPILLTRFQPEILEIYLKYGANPNIPLKGQSTSILGAYLLDPISKPNFFESKFRCIQLLLEKGADPNNPHVLLNIIEVCPKYYKRLFKLLLFHKAIPDRIHESFSPSLSELLSEASPDLVYLLLKAGANPNSTSQNGDFPLFRSCENGDMRRVKLLICFGADTQMKWNGTTSCEQAAISKGFNYLTPFLSDPEGFIDRFKKEQWSQMRLLFIAREKEPNSFFSRQNLPFDIFKLIIKKSKLIGYKSLVESPNFYLGSTVAAGPHFRPSIVRAIQTLVGSYQVEDKETGELKLYPENEIRFTLNSSHYAQSPQDGLYYKMKILRYNLNNNTYLCQFDYFVEWRAAYQIV